MPEILPGQTPETFIVLGIVGIVAGLVRGFTGFGAALIFMPVASSLIDPRLAAGAFLLVDQISALPLVVRALRVCDWKTVLPAALAAICIIPVGAAVLATGDTMALRWGISVAALLLVGLIASGWRYQGTPVWPVSLGVGAVAGFVSGVAQVGGPPVVAYWMSGPAPAAVIRANLIGFFFLTSVGAFTAYWWNGIITPATWPFVAALLPAYALSIWGGAALFRRTDDRSYRRVAFVLIAAAAVTSMPLFDNMLR